MIQKSIRLCDRNKKIKLQTKWNHEEKPDLKKIFKKFTNYRVKKTSILSNINLKPDDWIKIITKSYRILMITLARVEATASISSILFGRLAVNAG